MCDIEMAYRFIFTNVWLTVNKMGVVSVIMLPLSFQPPWQCLDLPARGCGAAKLLHCSLLSLLIVVGCLCFCPSTLAVVHRPHASAESEMVSLVTLPHPRTGEGVFFALAPASGTLLEATRQATGHRLHVHLFLNINHPT
ncbi:hypothetical protein BC830DRAFT_1157993 [Chytriomyces sp. MP71]|nr:hypothetical protein BC830DRAFT_1157993 [Chytriomyces sp. MP71]